VVTVRTESDGSFEYIFEKELEDGNHEIFLGMIDNTGALFAQSEPFKFIKAAEAFVPFGSATSSADSTQESPGFINQSVYKIIIGIGFIAFGLILLMLGINLREKLLLKKVPLETLHKLSTPETVPVKK
jgi:hypothetical protein